MNSCVTKTRPADHILHAGDPAFDTITDDPVRVAIVPAGCRRQ